MVQKKFIKLAKPVYFLIPYILRQQEFKNIF